MTTQPEFSQFVPTQAAPPTLRTDDIQVRWVMPEVFYDLPLHEQDDDEAVRLLEALAEKALPGADEDDKTKFAVVCALGLDDLLASGAEYAGICVAAVADAPCTATVFASLVDSPDTGEGGPAPVKEIAAELRRASSNEVSEIQLPCGPAVSCTGTRDTKVTGDLTETGEGLTFPTWFIRVYVPLPNATALVIELSTPTPTGWDTFSTMFGNVVSSIRLFTADGSPLIVTSGTAA